MTQFATAAEFGQRMGLTLTAGETTRANALLAFASGLIQSETGQTITSVADDELVCRGSYDSRLRLPERPVEAVASVEVDGVAVDATDWYVDGDEIVRESWPVASERRFAASGIGWGGESSELTITYTHGYSTIPELVKAVCMEMVARVWVNPGNARSEQYGGEAVSYQNSPGLLLTDIEREALNSVLRRTAGSVKLR